MRSLFFSAALSLAGCSGEVSTAECLDHSECGSGEACQSGKCAAVECVTSFDCALDHYCTTGYTCSEGCENDGDCRAGSSCDLVVGECVTDTCSDTAIDCGIGELCELETGECNDAGKTWCEVCERSQPFECGTEDAVCFSAIDPTVAYCWNACETDEDCARGFYCEDQEIVDGGPPKICMGDCSFYVEKGYL